MANVIDIERPKLSIILLDDGTYTYQLDADGWTASVIRNGKSGKYFEQGFASKDIAQEKGRNMKRIFNEMATAIERGKAPRKLIIGAWLEDGTVAYKPKYVKHAKHASV
jgi:hypothetical protein